MTAVSPPAVAEDTECPRFPGVARGSQRTFRVFVCSLAALAGSGCIVAPAPDYRDPEPTKPNVTIVSPSTQFPIVVSTPPPDVTIVSTAFSMVVQSEDADERLVLAFFVDYGLEGMNYLYHDFAPPSTFAERRPVSIPVRLVNDPRIPDGCHTITMLVMHEPSWNQSMQRPYPDLVSEDVSTVNWLLHVNVKAGETPVCPTR